MAAPTSNNEVTARRLSRLLVGADGNGGLWKKVNDKVSGAIGALDVSSVGGAGKYISAISETDGKISATSTTMDTAPTASSTNAVTSGGVKTALDGKASSTHTHGNIQNGGTLQTSDITIANGDKLVVTDASDSNKIARTSISFDGSQYGYLLSKKGTWEYPKEAYLTWGGRNITGDFGTVDAAMVPDLGANRFAFGKGEGITIEYTRDGGTTWVDYGLSTAEKSYVFSTGASLTIGKADSNNKATSADNYAKYKLRITLSFPEFGLYTYLQKLVFYISTNGSSSCYVIVSKQTKTAADAGGDWTTVGEMNLSGWSGYNVFNTAVGTTYSWQASHLKYVRFVFETRAAGDTTYNGLSIGRILGFGGVGWNVPSNLAKNGHLYSYDNRQNATFPANVTATKFVGLATDYDTTTGTIRSTFNNKTDFASVTDATIDSNTTATSVQSYFNNNVTALRAKVVYKQYSNENLLLFGKGSANYGVVVKAGYDSRYLYLMRKSNGTWVGGNAWEKVYAGYADSAGTAQAYDTSFTGTNSIKSALDGKQNTLTVMTDTEVSDLLGAMT